MSMSALQQLSSILLSELNQSKQLQTLLSKEREALKVTDIDAIQLITQQKQPLLIQLEQLGRQRDYLLKTAGFSAGKAGLDAFIANHAEAEVSKLTQVLTELREVARSCRESNQVNGGILNVNRQYLGRALSILRGRDPEIGAYGPGGEYTSQVVRQPLIGRV